MGNPCFCQWASKLAPLCHIWPCFSLPTKYCSTKRACACTCACAGSSLYRRPHARTHAHAPRTHTHHRSLASRSAPRLEPRSWCVCVLCDRNVVLFLDKPLSGALERPRGRKWGTCDPHLPQQGCFSQASPLGVALKAEKVPYLVPYVP